MIRPLTNEEIDFLVESHQTLRVNSINLLELYNELYDRKEKLLELSHESGYLYGQKLLRIIEDCEVYIQKRNNTIKNILE